ncbi:putative isomerase YbhE [Xylariomycetidae sp. FL0641]|nr:putative isomerase YbhE [Xylariomycetidae sp. FL0641]
MVRNLATFLTLGLASAAAVMKRDPAPATTPRKLLVGAPFQILTAEFDGTNFSITGNNTVAGTAPSWLLPKEPNLLYAVNENADDINVLRRNGTLSHHTTGKGSAGVVFLEFNQNKNRMVGAAYGSGAIDVWDTSNPSGQLKLMKSINITGPLGPDQTSHRPHQALLDPTGRFFVLPDLGGDQLLVLDAADDKFAITGNQTLPAGSGPRHGGFLVRGDATYYALATELSSELFLFRVAYDDAGAMRFDQLLQQRSTYGEAFPPANASTAAAGELVVARNMQDVYVSNRLSGNATDSIAHFRLDADADKPQLRFVGSVSSAGKLPRMFSLGTDEKQETVFVANQDGENGLVALGRCGESGMLHPTPVATLPMRSLVAPQLLETPAMGPQFVMEVR